MKILGARYWRVRPQIKYNFEFVVFTLQSRNGEADDILHDFGARFRNANGKECVAYLNLENRNVNLYNVENDWNDNDRFGRSCKCLHFI